MCVCRERVEHAQRRRERSIIAGAAFRALEDVRLEKHGLDGKGVGDMLRDQASSVQQLTKLREAKERGRKAKEKSDKIPDTVATELMKWCTACGDPDCNFAPIEVKVPKKGRGKR